MGNTTITLSELIGAAKDELHRLDYRQRTVIQAETAWNQLYRFANGIGEMYYSQELVERFLLEKFGYPFGDKTPTNGQKATVCIKRRAFRKLEWVLNFSHIVKGAIVQKVPLANNFSTILAAFRDWGIKRAYSKITQETYRATIRKFTDYLINNKISQYSDIEPSHISDYVVTLRGHAKSTIKKELGCLSIFFKFLYLEKYHPKNLSDSIPRFHYGKSSSISKIWTQDEIQRLLASVDRGTAIGKRDYAILLMATELGIRDSDIRTLKFDDINWEKCAIEFIQSKTGVPISLPLSENLGLAIIDYLKYGRPNTSYDNVFVAHIHPYGELGRSGTCLQKYIHLAGIATTTERHHGLHSLRHTVATRLLEENVPVDVIMPMLGHADESSIHVYLSMDIENLRKCALSFKAGDVI